MKRATRSKQLDYKALNSCGQKVYKDSVETTNTEIQSSDHSQENSINPNSSVLELSELFSDFSLEDIRKEDSRYKESALNTTNSEAIDKLRMQLSILSEDIDDYIDENQICDSNTIEDLDNAVHRI